MLSSSLKAIMCVMINRLGGDVFGLLGAVSDDEERRGWMWPKKVVYESHAEEKFEILRRHGFVVSKRQVSETLRRPDKVEEGFRGRKVAAAENFREACPTSCL